MKTIALDTETTGLDLWHGCKPFYVSTVDDSGKLRSWEWPVDPFTREPNIPSRDIQEIHKLLKASDKIVFHNASFDIRALETIGLDVGKGLLRFITPLDWDKVEDTLIMSHCLDNLESHNLKDSALKYLDIPDDDQLELDKITIKARHIAKGLGWRIANDNDSHWPGMVKKPWGRFDTWLPAALLRVSPKASGLVDPTVRQQWGAVLKTYANRDVERTLLIYHCFQSALQSEGLLDQYQEQRKLIPVIYSMESRGVTLKPQALKREVAKYKQISEEYANRCTEAFPINLNSPKQLSKLLYSPRPRSSSKTNPRLSPDFLSNGYGFGLPILELTESEQPSTNVATLLKLRSLDSIHPQAKEFITNLLVSRKVGKAYGYVSSYNLFSRKEARGRFKVPVLHPNCNQTGTGTTRVAMSNPNGQNVGKPEDGSTFDHPGEEDLQEIFQEAGVNLRSVFGPAPDRQWISIDFQQLQLRIFAYISGEQSLIDAFEAGWDAHDFMAYRIFGLPEGTKPTKGQRRIGKNVNFGFIFGASPWKIEQTARKPGLWDIVVSLFPNAHRFIQATSNQVRRRGYVNCSNGYRLWVNRYDPYKGTNYIVQGDEGIIVKRAMVACHEYLKSARPDSPAGNTYLTLQVHDELDFDTPRAAGKSERQRQLSLISNLCRIMEEAGGSIGMKTPVEAEIISTSWDKGQPV